MRILSKPDWNSVSDDIIEDMTLLVKNVHVVGGNRTLLEPTDVFVSGDRISAIGNFSNKPADVVLDGQGAYLSPGFIDVDTDSDHYLTLFEYPSQEDFLRQGVTTIMGGMCGSSLAPLMYGGLESLRKWGNTDRTNVDWHSVAELLVAIDKHPLGVNFGTLIGHSTIRRAILGESIRDLTKSEMNVFTETFMTALTEGGFGLSTGLAYVHAHKTPYAELKTLADYVKRFNGVYATHLRDVEDGLEAAVQEAVTLVEDTDVKTVISHFVPIRGHEKEYERALQSIEALPQGFDFRFDVYPSLSTMNPIYTFLPRWAQDGGYDVMLANLKDPWLTGKMIKDMPPIDEANFFVAQAPGGEFLVGKSLTEIKQLYNLSDGREALLRLMSVLSMRGTVLYKNINEALLMKALVSKRSFIASNAPSFDFSHERRLKSERTSSTFTKFLSLVQEKNIMPLEDGIRKITSEPARMFNLDNRGEIKEGNFADLTCFRGSEIKFTIVNGVLAMQDGQYKGTLSGKALRHPMPK